MMRRYLLSCLLYTSIYQAYTLEHVLEILHAEDNESWNYSVEIKVRFMQSEINLSLIHILRAAIVRADPRKR